MYTCATALVDTVTIETNPVGQTPARVWNTLYDDMVTESTITTSLQGPTSTIEESISPPSTSSDPSGSTGMSQDSSNKVPLADSTDAEDRGLSTTSIIGIAVGGGLAICAVIIGGFWYYRSNKRRRQILYHQQPSPGYGYATAQPFVANPHPHGWQQPKPVSEWQPVAPQNYGPSQNYDRNPTSSHPVSQMSFSPPLLSGRYEIDSSNRPPSSAAELGPGR